MLAGGWTLMDAALERGDGREMPHYCKVKSDSCRFKSLLESHWDLQGEITDDLRQKELVPFPMGRSYVLVKIDRCFLGTSRGQKLSQQVPLLQLGLGFCYMWVGSWSGSCCLSQCLADWLPERLRAAAIGTEILLCKKGEGMCSWLLSVRAHCKVCHL